MAVRKRVESSFVAFDVTYVDGTRTSNRRVPSTALGGLDGDEPAKEIIREQDAAIGAASGKPRPEIAAVERSPLPEVVKLPAKKKF